MSRVLIVTLAVLLAGPSHAFAQPGLDARVRGLLLGGLIGDAAGAPVEFVDTARFDEPGVPFRRWAAGERLDPEDHDAYGDALTLMAYARFRPDPEPYAHWLADAPPGTVTDDSRQKFIVLGMLRELMKRGERASTATLGEHNLARAYLDWTADLAGADTEALNDEWLAEYLLAARWVLGERDPERALPASRLWGGLPTCAGQMALPPLAAVFPGDPEGAYELAYRVAFIDNGEARDINAGLVAGLSAALVAEDWNDVKRAMIRTDPHRYAEVPWVERPLSRWLHFAEDAAARANSEPAELSRIIEEELPRTTWWDAHVTLVMAFAAMELAGYHPGASMRLAIELGRDTDSTAQIVGLFMGAMHGDGVFGPGLGEPVEDRLEAEYAESIDEWARVIERLRRAPPR